MNLIYYVPYGADDVSRIHEVDLDKASEVKWEENGTLTFRAKRENGMIASFFLAKNRYFPSRQEAAWFVLNEIDRQIRDLEERRNQTKALIDTH